LGTRAVCARPASMAAPRPAANQDGSGQGKDSKEEQCVRFVDADGRVCLFELHRSGTFNVYVDGRQKMVRVKKLYSEDLMLHLDGNKIMSSVCKVKVPLGQDQTVLRVMELFCQRRQAAAVPAPLASPWAFLTIRIVGAQGLRNADKYSKSDPYCTCEVRGKPSTKFKTRVIENNLEPIWNHVADITGFVEGDTLIFRVFDKDWLTKDDPLGCAMLKLDQTRLPCFDGDLKLEGEGAMGLDSSLKVHILAGTESERTKHSARKKVEEALEIRTIAALSAAVSTAKECGLVKTDFEEAENLLQRLTTKMTVAERLWEAVHGKSLDALREALRAAQAADIEAADVDRAKAEVQKRLTAAHRAGSISGLEVAIGFAQAFDLDGAEYRDAVAFRDQEVAKRAAREQLLKACHDCIPDALREAIKHAEEVGLQESEIRFAKEMLASGQLELKKTLARRRLNTACDDYEAYSGIVAEQHDEAWFAFKELRDAMKAGEELGLSVEDLARAQALCKIEQQRMAMQELCQVMSRHSEILRLCEGALRKMKEYGTPPPDEFKDEMREAKDELKEAIAVVRNLEVSENEQLKKAEQMRKKLHNILEDLKGSLRVICRVRPMSQKESASDHQVLSRFDYMTVEVTQELNTSAVRTIRTPRGKRPPAEKHQYHFDAVFQPGSQEEIFQDCADIVQSVLDGYNATVFAYGQTGAGKTHTMFGDPGNPGIGPRTIDELYAVMENNSGRLDYKVEASIMELYCDHLGDLLVKNGPAAVGSRLSVEPHSNQFDGYPNTKSPRDCRASDLIITHDERGAVIVNNLTSQFCNSREDLHRVLKIGSANREVAKTQKNDRSSRSHLMMIIRVKSVDKERNDRPVSGKLILCDLAGSERTKSFPQSMALEKQMMEANEINKSLTALADVITALVEKHQHVPYRNHKLTQILQDTLGGSAKALMFVNCSPAHSNLGETVSSLNWATCAKGITNTFHKTGPPGAKQQPPPQQQQPPRGSVAAEKHRSSDSKERRQKPWRENGHPATVAARS